MVKDIQLTGQFTGGDVVIFVCTVEAVDVDACQSLMCRGVESTDC